MSNSAKERCSTEEWTEYHHNIVAGHKTSDDTKKKMSEAHVNKKHSDETCMKIRESLNGDPVMCVEINMVFDCAKDAGIALNIGKTASGPILQCCRGERKTYGGYHWQLAINIQESDGPNETIQ